jgi:hypothetical protein
LPSGVVMVSGTDGDSGYLGQLANPSTNGPRLHGPRLLVKHVEEVPGYADQIPIPAHDSTAGTIAPGSEGPP